MIIGELWILIKSRCEVQWKKDELFAQLSEAVVHDFSTLRVHRHKCDVVKERVREREKEKAWANSCFVVCKCELPVVFSLVLFGVLMLIGRLPIQRPFVCRDCRFNRAYCKKSPEIRHEYSYRSVWANRELTNVEQHHGCSGCILYIVPFVYFLVNRQY